MSGSKCLITGATGATAPPPHHSFSIKASMFVLSCIARTNDPKNFASVGRRSGRSDRSTSVIQQTSDSKADVEEGPGRVKTRKSARLNGMSVLPPTADVVGPPRHVRKV